MENMGMNAGGPDAEVKNLLLQGFRAAKENRREEAYQIFCDVVARDPNNEYGWLYRAATTDSRSEAYVCLEKVLSINPNNEKAQRGLKRIQEQQQEEGEGESEGGYQAASEAGRVGSAEYVSDTNRSAPARGVYDAPPASTYPYGGEDRSSAYPNNFDRPVVPPPPPPPSSGYADTQPRPGYDNNYYGNNAGPSVSDYPDSEVSAQDATRDRLRGRNKKGGAVVGADPNTDLDDNGRERQGRARNSLLIPLLLLLLLLLIVGGIFFITNNNNAGTQQALDPAAAATATAQASGTGANTGTTTVGGGAGVVTAAGANTSSAATTAAGNTGATTAAGGGAGATTVAGNTGATTVAGGATNPNATTAAGGGAATTAPGGATAVPSATPVPPAATTPPPANTTVVAPPGIPGSGTAVSTRPVIYTVVRGDALIRIANQFGTSADAIRAANRYTQPITGDAIFAGNRYIIPVSRPDFRGSGHVVAQGDTLASIASKYNTSPEAIIKLNGLSGPNDIKPGDPLLIP